MISKKITLITIAYVALCFVNSVWGQITPPPPGNSPVEANGRLYNLNYVPSRCKDPYIIGQEDVGGGVVIKAREKKVLMEKYGPYKINGNIEIEPDGCLVIMPGVWMYFDPGFGIIINGTLIARGTYDRPDGRIVMTKNPNATNHVGANSPWPTDARLVDGNTTRDGRLDLLYNGKWRGVCTNYNNFTAIDLNVTCRHLGFVYGNFTYHSFSRNETEYMLYEKPACRGSENSLFECPGASNIKYGARICDGQQVVGFQCVGLRHDLAKDHWRGLEFYNATSDIIFDPPERLKYNASLSFLEYLDIEYAGLDIYKVDGVNHGRASISASPYVPIMNNLTIVHGAYDALNLTDIKGEIHIANSTVSNNRGYGMFIHTAVGRVLVNKTDIEYNWGDGLKMYISNYTINEFNRNFPSGSSFCRTPSISQPSFPILLHEDLITTTGDKPVGTMCSKSFKTKPGKHLTLHTLIMERDPEASGELIVRDGGYNGPIILELPINNGSFPQSVTTDTDEIWIELKYQVPPRPPSHIDPTKRCKHLRGCIRFLMELTSNYGPDIELRLYNGTVRHNNGYGVNMQDMRSKVFINSSVISDNGYGAGVRIYQGAGEVAINYTVIERNMMCGVNITYSGGYQLFNMTTIAENYGYGVITEYLRVNKTRFELLGKQKIEVVRSNFVLNEWTAFRIGNYCNGGEYLFNLSYFGHNQHEAIEYLSCNISTPRLTILNIKWNDFVANKRHALLISPVANTAGLFTNNTFSQHTVGVLRLNNGYDFIENRWYKELNVDFNIIENLFTNNTGRYVVNFRLSQPGPKHRIQFKFNRLKYNVIKDPFEYLNPRSKADAVIVVSSGNVEVQRNLIDNPNSAREIATHLIDPSVTILANYNYWMTTSHQLIYMKLFDRKNRFNLAELKYHPVLKNDWLYGDFDTSEDPEFRWTFERGSRIGGVLDGNLKLNPAIRRFRVDRDIIVLKGAFLEISAGTTLEFESSIGMVVHGRLKADGNDVKFGPPEEIVFKLYEDEIVALENRTIYERVRLLDGATEFEGRLELNVSGEFGTVCNDGWTEQNSALVCQMLGLTFNPTYGVPEQIVYTQASPILMSRVSCDQLDTSIFDCRSEVQGEFQCDHTQDVFIKCQPPTWSGVTLAATPRFSTPFETRINRLTIDKAGLLDFVEMSYTAGLRIDYSFYKMDYITVKNGVSDGVSIKYCHPYSMSEFRWVNAFNNLGNGIVTRSPFLYLKHLTVQNNNKAGLVYDPMFTEYEALSVRNFMDRDIAVSLTDTPSITLASGEMKFITTTVSQVEEDKTYMMQVFDSSTSAIRNKITVQLLDYNPLTSIEKVVFYGSAASSWQTARSWAIEEDLVDFPIVSPADYITIRYTVKGIRSGRLAFAIISTGYSENLNSIIDVYNATIKNNERGIMTKHYNNPSNEKLEIFHRAKQETLSFNLMNVEGNLKEAMFIPSLTKYHTNFIPTLEEMTRPEKVGAITYRIQHSVFKNNKKGIHAEHNHVDFANNVWKWNVNHVTISDCESGGFEIELPRVNDLHERQFHSVNVSNSAIFNNKRFAFGVIGYYADVEISNNHIRDNECFIGIVEISGMEKKILFKGNRIEQNSNCKYAIKLDLTSHSEYATSVSGVLRENNVVNNRHSYRSQGLGTSNTPVTYGIGIYGVQNISVMRNVFDNQELQYELVAGITSLILQNTLNVKENYWGTTDQYMIRERIFDFDDWNNYAIAEYFPFLGGNTPESDLATDTEIKVELDLNHLGGRIWQDLTIPARAEPYIVYSDLTVMPNVKFTIPPGTEMQFYPNVGILVLGQLIATGVPYSRIKFGPAVPTNSGRGKRDAIAPFHPEALTASDVRLVGGKMDNEGFLELYNASSRSWNIMCDSQFNEKTAEVVCRSKGFETVNVDVRFTPLYDFFVYGKPMYFLKEFWGYSYYCKGDEDSLDQCMKRINYAIKSCIFSGKFTFIRCGERNLPTPMDYWGNIRFAHPKYEEEIRTFIRDQDRSRLQYVDIDGAGMLHGEKVGAVQTTYVNPILDHMNITRCVSNGFDVVAPRHGVDILYQNISGNLGYGINVLVLNGDSTSSTMSTFNPLVANTVPYNLYGLVDICRMEKEIIVENRLLLFYKYSQSSYDCVKIIRGYSQSVGSKRVALRFLQFSLFEDDFYRNLIEIFDGDEITANNQLVRLIANSTQDEIRTKYQSTGNYLSIHMHASPSYGFYGFIAEVVTLPLSGLTYPDDSIHHTVRQVIMKGNQDGALLYKNVGDITPSVFIDQCWIQGNGIAILNLTSPPVIDVGLQSTRLFNLQNSFIARNKGGTYIDATTPSAATKLRANITNNVFAYGTHGEVLNLTGHHYEKFFLYENYIYNNTAGDYRDTIHVQNVVVNFTFNTVTNNTGHYVVRLYNIENTDATQEYNKNLFVGNNATAVYRALFHVGSGNPIINHNYLVNEECDFELETNPVNKLPDGSPGNAAPINARNNWWGSESTGYVNGKIWDKLDNNSLVAVDFMPIKINDNSLIYGKCAPGWFLEEKAQRCYKFMGGALPYKEANQFCMANGGFLAASKDKQEFFKYLLRLTMNTYNPNRRVWVYSDVGSGRCSAFEQNYVVDEYDCYFTMHPFICEKDPYIAPPGSDLYAAVIGISAGVFGLAVIIIVVLVILWRFKSKKRSKERFERQSSIRSSIKGTTIRGSRSTMSMISGHSKRRLDQLSMASSKYLYDDKSLAASQISLGGVTEDETNTDPNEARRQLRQRAEIARGRQEGESPRYDRHNFRNGHANKGRRDRGYSEDSEHENYDEDRRYGRRQPPPRQDNYHSNGGYKYSDESHNHSEHSDDEDVKKPLTSSEDEEDRRNSFTPVKFKPGSEKELDSIQYKPDGSIQYLRQDDTGSVDLSGTGGRHLSRSMSSFSAHDAHSDTPSQGENHNYRLDAPTPPPPLPMNIPAKLNMPARPQLRPVPAPRPKPLPSARSYGSQENITETDEPKMNNLSQDESSNYRGSRDRLDDGGFAARKVPSKENLNSDYDKDRFTSSSREKLPPTVHERESSLDAGVEFLQRSQKPDSNRNSPMIHGSRENLLPKRTDSDNYKPPLRPSYEPMRYPDQRFQNQLYDQANNQPYGYQGTAPGVDYIGRHTPQNTDYSDGAPGIDYLPKNLGTPMKSRHMVGQPQTPSSSDYESYDGGYQPQGPRTPRLADTTPSYYDSEPGNRQQYPSYTGAQPQVPYHQPPSYSPAESGTSYLPRSNYPQSPVTPSAMSRSRENLSRSRENLSHSREQLSRSRENLGHSRDNLSYPDQGIRENSRDVVKPRQQKSIETEI